MERFLRENAVHSSHCKDAIEFRDVFLSAIENVRYNKEVGSLLATVSCTCAGFVAPTTCLRNVLTADETDVLKELVLKITGKPYEVNSIYYHYTSFTIDGKCYRSSSNHTKQPAVALASWDESMYGPAPLVPCSSLIPSTCMWRPVNVFCFMKISDS